MKPALKRDPRGKGGVDWYRYHYEVILPKLVPFIEATIAEYGEAFLVQDGASPHASWQHEGVFDIQGLTVLPHPANSPNLNQIEPCWYPLKRLYLKDHSLR